MNDKLTKAPTMPNFGLGKRGIGKNLVQSAQELEKLDPLTRQNRIGLVCDDSVSMTGQPINDAHSAVANFATSCRPIETSITIYPLNATSKPLTCDYDVMTMYWNTIGATGGTPLYKILRRMIETEPITRAVVFSDGQPNERLLAGYHDNPKQVIALCKEKEIAVDTIYLGSGDNEELQELAKQTGGIYIHFTGSKSLSNNLKYLSPGLRGILLNEELKKKIEEGEKI